MSDQEMLEQAAMMLGAFHPQWRNSARKMLASEKAGQRTPLRDLVDFQREVERERRADREATQRFIDSSTVEVSKDGKVNIKFVQPPSKGTILVYPVRIQQHLPGLGFLVSDDLGSARDYWVAENSITNRNAPTVKAKVIETGLDRLKVSIQHTIDGHPIHRFFFTPLVQKHINENLVTEA